MWGIIREAVVAEAAESGLILLTQAMNPNAPSIDGRVTGPLPDKLAKTQTGKDTSAMRPRMTNAQFQKKMEVLRLLSQRLQ